LVSEWVVFLRLAARSLQRQSQWRFAPAPLRGEFLLAVDPKETKKSFARDRARLRRVPCVSRIDREVSQLASLKHTKLLFRSILRYSAPIKGNKPFRAIASLGPV